MKQPRRRFLSTAAATTAGMTFCCDAEAEALAAQAVAPGGGEVLTPGPRLTLPKLQLGKYQVSRIIIGGNPFYGYSHFNKLFSTHMTEWAIPERLGRVLRHCEHCGVNTWQFSHTERTVSDLARHRADGGKLQWILLSHKEIEEDHRLIKDVVKHQPIGIVHHGGAAERKRRAGQIGLVKDFLKAVRDSGVMVGLSTHDPRFLEQVEEENWDVDFYMTAIYYLTRTPEEFKQLLGQRPLGEVYLPNDPPRMFAAIRKTRRTCLCYKVLAAGRLTDRPEEIDAAFRMVFDNVKPNDGMIIGMYPRYSDQVRDNAERVLRILSPKKGT